MESSEVINLLKIISLFIIYNQSIMKILLYCSVITLFLATEIQAQYVGIGTDVPTATLDVIGTGLFRNGGSAGSLTGTQLLFSYNDDISFKHAIRSRHHGGLDAGNAMDFYVWDYGTDGTNAEPTKRVITIDGAGNGRVGIGTGSPSYPLHYYSASSTGDWSARFQNGTSNVYLSNGSGYGIHVNTGNSSSTQYALDITDGTNPIMYARNDGNVGIGTISPNHKLTIVGTGDVFGVDNTASFAAKNSSGAYETYFWPRWSNNFTYLRYGVGFDIANSAGTSAVFINNSGQVGIGTTSPSYPLHVHGYSWWTGTNRRYRHDNVPWEDWSQWTSATLGVGIYSNNSIMTSDYFISASDKRIKKDFELTNSTEDLMTVNQIEITNYALIDEFRKGNKTYKKVVAQQLEEAYPLAVSQITDFIPNIYDFTEMVSIDKDEMVMIMDNDVDLLIGDVIQVEGKNEGKEEFKVLAIDGNKIIVKTPQQPQDAYFVYGKQVNDFRVVDYDALTTLNISATQELYQKISCLENENVLLKSRQLETDKKLQQLTTDVDILKEIVLQYANK